MQTLRVNGYDMAYIELGQGRPGAPPLLCVHGSLCDFRVWSAVIGPLSAKHRVIAVSLRHFFPDKERQELVIRQSQLDWVIVRPARLTNGKRTGEYRHGFGPHEKIKGVISRADTAEFMLKQLTEDTYLRKTPGVSY